MTYLVLACRAVLVGVFVVSLFGKLRSRTAYRDFVAATATLLSTTPARARQPAKLTLTAELVVTCALLITPLTRPALVMATALLLCFTAALTQALLRGTRTPCRCFGRPTPVSPSHVLRNTALIAVAMTALITDFALTQ
ncbi:MauE/DoxX family redox-associated membrane protein [Allokutzneria albata]|uniref:Methylamine utilisation protein MauE n=1 Tax=Allokutzneria albata TaxID=211114 RepID=A0A1H0AGY4_ALLAB|nr:MauE/DoxX family redox-associated membrane protein [Allokutzneria albata]SDN32581.1 Methylamine utilisation protein MauE [Allokutzneria albata]